MEMEPHRQRLIDLKHGDGQEAIDYDQPDRQRKVNVEKAKMTKTPAETVSHPIMTTNRQGWRGVQIHRRANTDRQ